VCLRGGTGIFTGREERGEEKQRDIVNVDGFKTPTKAAQRNFRNIVCDMLAVPSPSI
jgi:hypothetical protein